MRLSKRTNELIKNWQMGIHSAVLCVWNFAIMCVCYCVCVCVLQHNASYFHILSVSGQKMYVFY